MFAVVRTGGKQYRVADGDKIIVEKIEGEAGTAVALETLMTGEGAALTMGGAVKAVQAFQKDTKKSETKGGLFEGKLLSQSEIKAIGDLPSKEVLMAQIAGAINAVATKVAVGINEVPSGLARALKQHADGEGTAN